MMHVISIRSRGSRFLKIYVCDDTPGESDWGLWPYLAPFLRS